MKLIHDVSNADLVSVFPIAQQVVGVCTVVQNISNNRQIEDLQLGIIRLIPVLGTIVSLARVCVQYCDAKQKY